MQLFPDKKNMQIFRILLIVGIISLDFGLMFYYWHHFVYNFKREIPFLNK